MHSRESKYTQRIDLIKGVQCLRYLHAKHTEERACVAKEDCETHDETRDSITDQQ